MEKFFLAQVGCISLEYKLLHDHKTREKLLMFKKQTLQTQTPKNGNELL